MQAARLQSRVADGARQRHKHHPSPAGGGWPPQAAGWGVLNQDPTRLLASLAATLPLRGRDGASGIALPFTCTHFAAHLLARRCSITPNDLRRVPCR
jgi:hypothetical protein